MILMSCINNINTQQAMFLDGYGSKQATAHVVHSLLHLENLLDRRINVHQAI